MTSMRKTMSATVAALAAVLMGTGAALAASTNEAVTAVVEPLNDQTTARWDTEGSGIRRDIVASETAPGGAAIEFRVRRAVDEAWRTRATVPIIADIKEGDEIELVIWVRAERVIRSLGTGNVDLQIVRTSEPYDNIFSENIRPTEEGQFYTVRGVAGADFDADDVVFGANLGFGRQTIQFGPMAINRVGSVE